MMNRKQRQKVLRECKQLAVYTVLLMATVGATKITARESDPLETESTKEQVERVVETEGQTDVEEAIITIFNMTAVDKQEPESESTEELEEPERFSDRERYLLAKIAMAEAEGEDVIGKALVIRVVLNRVDCDYFPNTIEGVIFQKNQFSPIRDGRWDMVEPNRECYIALDKVIDGWDESDNALYFESRSSSTWHRDNLKYLFQHGNHYFYTEKGM